MERFPDGYILEKYSNDTIFPISSRPKYPKNFQSYEVVGDVLCKSEQDVIDFFKENYNLNLDMTIFE